MRVHIVDDDKGVLNVLSRISAHILLVEDDPAQLADIRGILEALGYRITGAESAEAALRLVEQTRFDVILTDNILPGMTGLQALTRLRASGAPVIVMSSEYSPDTEKDALLIGAAAFIKKPLAVENLSRLIRQALDSGILERRRLEYHEKTV